MEKIFDPKETVIEEGEGPVGKPISAEEIEYVLIKQGKMAIDAMMIPAFRQEAFLKLGTHHNVLFRTSGGMGDEICAEPTIRFCMENFRHCEFSLATRRPELFKHLKFQNVYNLTKEDPPYDNFMVVEGYCPSDHMAWDFLNHADMHCVDFSSILAIKGQLPVKDREIMLKGDAPADSCCLMNKVVIHPGRNWQSKTFPREFWDPVIEGLVSRGVEPVLIGQDVAETIGTVDVSTAGCIDMRNKLTISESIWVTQNASVLITNDSSPLHMAASGNAWIAMISTCKHPDTITHWRKGVFGYKTKNFSKGGMWEQWDMAPNKRRQNFIDAAPWELMKTWLPEPKELANWSADRHWGWKESEKDSRLSATG